MLLWEDGLRVFTRSNFSLFFEISHLMLILCQPVPAVSMYQKYFQNVLNETYATVYASMGIQSVLECEQICSEHGFGCVGANVFTSGKHHVCLLFSQIRTPVSEDVFISNRNGKLIVKIEGKVKLVKHLKEITKNRHKCLIELQFYIREVIPYTTL